MTVSADQLVLAQKRQINAIVLMTLTTYTDRTAGTVDSVYYFADRGVRFDPGTGTAVDWLPFINDVGDLNQEMPHLAGPDTGPITFLRTMRVEMRNGDVDGTDVSLFTTLNGDNVVNARVRIFELLLPDDEWHPTHETLASLAGEQTPFYSGIIEQITDITADRFSINLRAEIPALDHDIVNSLDADGVVRGRIANDVYGVVYRIPCHGYDVGEAQTLVKDLPFGDTDGVFVADVGNFPDAGEIMIGRERITYTSKDENQHLLGGTITRGYPSGGLNAVGHAAGELVVNIQSEDTKYIVARHSMDSIDEVWIRSPLDNRLMYIEPGEYTSIPSTLSDLPAGIDGPVAIVKFSPQNIRDLIAKFYAQAEYGMAPTTEFIINSVPAWSAFVENTGSNTFPTGVNGPGDMVDVDNIISGSEIELTHESGGLNPPAEGQAYQWQGLVDVAEPVDRWRVSIKFDEIFGRAGNSGKIRPRVYINNHHSLVTPTPPAGRQVAISENYAPNGNPLIDETLYSEWYYTPPGVNLSSFNENSSAPNWGNIYVYVTLSNNSYSDDNYVKWQVENFKLETVHIQAGNEEGRLTDANSATRFQAGQGLEVFVDGSGYQAPDGTNYSVPQGILMQSSSDIARHLIAERAGMGHEVIDDASWGKEIDELGLTHAEFWMSPNQVVHNPTPGNGPTDYTLYGASTYKNVSSVDVSDYGVLDSFTAFEQGIVWTFDDTLDNDKIIKRWRVYVLGDYTGSANKEAKLWYSIRNIPAGAGGLTEWEDSEGATSEEPYISSNSTGTTNVDDAFTLGWYYPTVPLTLNDFNTINKTDWDGVHVACQAQSHEGSEAVNVTIKTVLFQFETLERGFVESDMGHRLDSVLGRLGFETRSQIVNVEGPDGVLFKWLMANKLGPASYGWDVNGDPITEWGESFESTRRLQAIYSRYQIFDLPERSFMNTSLSQEELYIHAIRVTPKVSDHPDFTPTTMENVEKATGNVENYGMFFVSTTPPLTEEVTSYFISESIRYPASDVKLTGVPWTQAYDRSMGDVFMLQLSYWPAAKKVRIIGLEKNFAVGSIDVTVVEVN